MHNNIFMAVVTASFFSVYKLVHDSEIQNNRSNGLDEIHQYTEVFAVADRETRHVTIP